MKIPGIIYQQLIDGLSDSLLFIPYIPGAGKFIELSSGRENNERDLRIAENGELKSLLQQPVPPLGEGHLPACGVLYPFHLRFPSYHLFLFLFLHLKQQGKERNRKTVICLDRAYQKEKTKL